LIIANDLARAAVGAGGPVVRLDDCFEPVEDAQGLRTVVDQLPGARELRIDLALALPRTAARPLKSFLAQRVIGQMPAKSPGIDRRVGKSFGQCLERTCWRYGRDTLSGKTNLFLT